MGNEEKKLTITGQSLDCPVRLVMFETAPRSFPCGHSFCDECIGRITRKPKRVEGMEPYCECPTCRGRLFKSDGYPKINFAVKTIMDSAMKVDDSETKLTPSISSLTEDTRALRELLENSKKQNKHLQKELDSSKARLTTAQKQLRKSTPMFAKHGKEAGHLLRWLSSLLVVGVALSVCLYFKTSTGTNVSWPHKSIEEHLIELKEASKRSIQELERVQKVQRQLEQNNDNMLRSTHKMLNEMMNSSDDPNDYGEYMELFNCMVQDFLIPGKRNPQLRMTECNVPSDVPVTVEGLFRHMMSVAAKAG